MAAIQLTDLPAEIETFEALAVWVIEELAVRAQNRTAPIELAAGFIPLCSSRIITGDDGRMYARLAAYIPVSWQRLNDSDQKTWMAAEQIVG